MIFFKQGRPKQSLMKTISGIFACQLALAALLLAGRPAASSEGILMRNPAAYSEEELIRQALVGEPMERTWAKQALAERNPLSPPPRILLENLDRAFADFKEGGPEIALLAEIRQAALLPDAPLYILAEIRLWEELFSAPWTTVRYRLLRAALLRAASSSKLPLALSMAAVGPPPAPDAPSRYQIISELEGFPLDSSAQLILMEAALSDDISDIIRQSVWQALMAGPDNADTEISRLREAFARGQLDVSNQIVNNMIVRIFDPLLDRSPLLPPFPEEKAGLPAKALMSGSESRSHAAILILSQSESLQPSVMREIFRSGMAQAELAKALSDPFQTHTARLQAKFMDYALAAPISVHKDGAAPLRFLRDLKPKNGFFLGPEGAAVLREALASRRADPAAQTRKARAIQILEHLMPVPLTLNLLRLALLDPLPSVRRAAEDLLNKPAMQPHAKSLRLWLAGRACREAVGGFLSFFRPSKS